MKQKTYQTPIGIVKFPKTKIGDKEHGVIFVPAGYKEDYTASWKFQLVFDPKTKQAKELLDILNVEHYKIKGANFNPTKKDLSKNDAGDMVETGLVAINFTSGYPPKMVDAELNPCNVKIGWGSKIRVKFTIKPVNNKGKVGLGRYTRLIQVIDPKELGINTDGFEKEEGFVVDTSLDFKD